MKNRKILFSMLIAAILSFVLVAPAFARSPIQSYITDDMRQIVIRVFTIVIVLVTALVYYFGGARKGEDSGLWKTAAVFSTLCLMGICTIWYMVDQSSPDENAPEYYNLMRPVKEGGKCEELSLAAKSSVPTEGSPIHVRSIDSQKDVDCMVDEQNKLAQDLKTDMPFYVPTGVFIQSMEFTSANNVTVTGYIWQQYPNEMPDGIEHGFIMPEGGSDIYANEDNAAYKKVQGDETVYGWYINTSLRQTFNYSQYPFDRQDIWLRLWHLNFDRNVILVPDLIAYDAEANWPQDSEIFLGLERDFVLERLTPERTYFNYHYNNYNVDFGINDYVGQSAFPELYYNVGVRREVLDAFVAYMIPMIILVLMAFGVQFIVTQIPEKMSMHGISTTGLIAYYASLFFIGILAQLDIRRTLNAPGVVYIEYFYFALYMILLLQTVNSVIFAASDDVGFLEYKDNLYPKVIFFPITLGLMFIITAYLFY